MHPLAVVAARSTYIYRCEPKAHSELTYVRRSLPCTRQRLYETKWLGSRRASLWKASGGHCGGSACGGVEHGFDGVESALAPPKKPAGESEVFDEVARFGSFGGMLFQ